MLAHRCFQLTSCWQATVLLLCFYIISFGGHASGNNRRISELSLPHSPEPGDPAVEKLLSDEIRLAFTQKTDMIPPEFAIVAYSTQQVFDGVNYFVKVRIGYNSYAHLRVHEARPSKRRPDPKPRLVAFQLGKQIDDPILYFLRSSYQSPSGNQRQESTDIPIVVPVYSMASIWPIIPPVNRLRQTMVHRRTTTPYFIANSEFAGENNFVIFTYTPLIPEQTIPKTSMPRTTLKRRATTTTPMMTTPFYYGTTQMMDVQIEETDIANSWGRETNFGFELTPEQTADDETRGILEQVRGVYVLLMEAEPDFFQLVSYRTLQQLATKTYFMKVYVSYNNWEHLRVSVSTNGLQAQPVLEGIKKRKSLFENIEYFDADRTLRLLSGNQDQNMATPVETGAINNTNADRSFDSTSGHLSNLLPADPTVTSITDRIKMEFMQRSSTIPHIFRAVSYSFTSLYYGSIYFIKVMTGLNTYIHLRIFVPPPGNHEGIALEGYQLGKSLVDEIEYFDASLPSASAAGSPVSNVATDVVVVTTKATTRGLYMVHSPSPLRRPSNSRRPNRARSIQAGADIQLLVSAIRPQFVNKVGFNPQTFTAISYIVKLVAGELYFVEVEVGNADYVHLRIYKPIPYTTEGSVLEGWRMHKTGDDELLEFAKDGFDLSQYPDTAFEVMTTPTQPTQPAYSLALSTPSAIDSSYGESSGNIVSSALSSTLVASSTTHRIVKSVKPAFLQQSVFQPPMFIATTERIKQASPGLMRFIKVQMNSDSYVHLKVLVRSGEQPQLISFDPGKTLEDRINYF